MTKPTVSISVFYKVKGGDNSRAASVDVDIDSTNASVQKAIADQLAMNPEDITLQISDNSPLFTKHQLLSLGIKTVTELANFSVSGRPVKVGEATIYPSKDTFSALEGLTLELLVYKAVNRNMDFKRAIPTAQGIKKYDAKVLLQLIAHMYSAKAEVKDMASTIAIALGGVKNLSSLAQVRSEVSKIMKAESSK